MKNANEHESGRGTRGPRRRMAALVAGVLAGAAMTWLAPPTAAAGPPVSDAATLAREADRARAAERTQERMLILQSRDRRWEEPAQHEALADAMRQTVAIMARHRAAARTYTELARSAQREAIERAIERARISEQRHVQSLQWLASDRRWALPSQHEPLANAMRQTVTIIERRRATAAQLESALRQMP